jgi:hypothetical protein
LHDEPASPPALNADEIVAATLHAEPPLALNADDTVAATLHAESNKVLKPKKTTKQKTKPDPNAPKRACSAFTIFSQAERANVKRDHPDAPNSDTCKLLAEMWKDADAETKAKYAALYAENKAKSDEARRVYADSKVDVHALLTNDTVAATLHDEPASPPALNADEMVAATLHAESTPHATPALNADEMVAETLHAESTPHATPALDADETVAATLHAESNKVLKPKKTTKQKTKPDPNAPKRASSAFIKNGD